MRSPGFLAASSFAVLGLGLSLFTACGSDPSTTPPDDFSDAGRRVDTGTVAPGDAEADAAQPGDQPFDGNTTPACIAATGKGSTDSALFRDGADETRVAVTDSACTRTFAFTTNVTQRDNAPKTRSVSEAATQPSVQSKSEVFDALYALALTEAREDSVSAIKDYAFQNGNPLPCAEGGCFETGEKWNYVWTRDTAYSMQLGLAAIDPIRAKNSLLFKVSPRRSGTGDEIVQDTGTGGSWPVSTDRVVWAIGAWETAKYLTGDVRRTFVDRAYEAIANTIDRDRAVVFDARDGLYRGEQSFLDWREQTYPGWVSQDLAHVAQSRTLSTNVTHLAILDVGEKLATERGDTANATRFRGYADALRTKIRDRFYSSEKKLFSTMITTELDPAPAARFDWLGTSLAVLYDVATPEQAKATVGAYPHLPKGAGVVFPQEQDTPIYHNRSIWPFVTAYGLKAAKKARNADVATRAVETLVRGSALSLSNMENFELVTGKTYVDEGPTSGPVVNSRRQLWSVAGYLSMVHDGIFGLEATKSSIRFLPYVPKKLRNTLFFGSDSIVLNNFPYHDKKITVVVKLPPAGGNQAGAYSIARVKLNGTTVGDVFLDETKLSKRNTLEVELADTPDSDASQKATVVTSTSDYKTIFAPRPPKITQLALDAGKIKLTLDPSGERAEDVTYRIFRDGQKIAERLPGSTTSYVDTSTSASSPSHCYTVETEFASGTTSHRANPQCYWGPGYSRIQSKTSADFTAVGGNLVTDYGRSFYEAWGDAGHKLTTTAFTAQATGDVLVQLSYGNGSGGTTTGITCATKLVRVEDTQSNAVVGEGYAVMPQRGNWSTWGDSSFVRVKVVQGKTYRVVVTDDANSVNMSAFQHFASYTGGTGGSSGSFFRVNVAEVKILGIAPAP